MWYHIAMTYWILNIFPDVCCIEFFYQRPPLHKRPKKIKPDATIITSSPSTKTYYNPNPGYDAYWTDGHWIFGTTTTKPTFSTSTRTRPMVCRKPCDIEYRYVGPVCAHRVDNIDPKFTLSPILPRWAQRVPTDPNKPHFYTFGTYCSFLNYQCSVKIWNYMSWVFVHFGTCLDDTTIYLPVEYDTQIYYRMHGNLDQYKRHLNQSLVAWQLVHASPLIIKSEA